MAMIYRLDPASPHTDNGAPRTFPKALRTKSLPVLRHVSTYSTERSFESRIPKYLFLLEIKCWANIIAIQERIVRRAVQLASFIEV